MELEAKNKLISEMKTALIDGALGDIKLATTGGSKMGAFILCSCLIEYVAGFRYGKGETKGKDYRNFVSEYLKTYDAENLYTDMRCKLVHNYSEGGSYNFMHDRRYLHLYRLGGFGKLCINLEAFIQDIENAVNQYFLELEKSKELLKLASLRMQKVGILKGSNIIDQ
jgi:hypothetical protein